MDKKVFNVEALINAVKQINATDPVTAIIPSYTAEFLVSSTVQRIELQTENQYCWFYIFTNQESFTQAIAHNLYCLDLTEGADDQFYDYNPSIFESLLYAADQLPALDKARLYNDLIAKVQDFQEWANDPENDEDGMLAQYQSYLGNIERKDLQGLEGQSIYNQIINALI